MSTPFPFTKQAYQCFKDLDEDMFEDIPLDDPQEEAAEGLLCLSHYRFGSDDADICDSDLTPSDPVHPLEPIPDSSYNQLPPITNLFCPTSPRNSTGSSIYSSSPIYQHYNSSCGSQISYNSSSRLLYSPSDDGASAVTLASPHSRPLSSSSTLIDSLSVSSSPISSFRSTQSNRSHKMQCFTKKKEKNFLSRAATFTRHRGRPKKNAHLTIETMPIDAAPTGPSLTKPRWQDSEKRELIEAIVKDKNLDDMASIRWDRISMTVGRAKKACKDQWRRVLLPDLLKRTDGPSSDPDHYHYSNDVNYNYQQISNVSTDLNNNYQQQSSGRFNNNIDHQQQSSGNYNSNINYYQQKTNGNNVNNYKYQQQSSGSNVNNYKYQKISSGSNDINYNCQQITSSSNVMNHKYQQQISGINEMNYKYQQQISASNDNYYNHQEKSNGSYNGNINHQQQRIDKPDLIIHQEYNNSHFSNNKNKNNKNINNNSTNIKNNNKNTSNIKTSNTNGKSKNKKKSKLTKF